MVDSSYSTIKIQSLSVNGQKTMVDSSYEKPFKITRI
jgi:hypothetical protein